VFVVTEQGVCIQPGRREGEEGRRERQKQGLGSERDCFHCVAPRCVALHGQHLTESERGRGRDRESPTQLLLLLAVHGTARTSATTALGAGGPSASRSVPEKRSNHKHGPSSLVRAVAGQGLPQCGRSSPGPRSLSMSVC
jgi:hypothetical protein